MSPLSTGAELVAEHVAVLEAEVEEISGWLVAPWLPPAVDVATEDEDAAEAGLRLRWWWKRLRRTDGPILECPPCT